jgi:hypothetical protein
MCVGAYLHFDGSIAAAKLLLGLCCDTSISACCFEVAGIA